MIITCEACGTRFNFDESLLKNKQSVSVKCANCKSVFKVMSLETKEGGASSAEIQPGDIEFPSAPESFPAFESHGSEETTETKGDEFELPETSDAPPDFSFGDAETKETEPPRFDVSEASSPLESAPRPAEPEPTHQEENQSEERGILAGETSEDDVEPSLLAPSEKVEFEFEIPEGHTEEEHRERTDLDSEGLEKKGSKIFKIIGVLLLAAFLTGAGVFGWLFYSHKFQGSSKKYEITNLKGGYVGNILTVKFEVKNLSKRTKNYFQVETALLDDKKKILSKDISYCGNIIENHEIPLLKSEDIMKKLKNREGAGLSNMAVYQGEIVRCMMVFLKTPENVKTISAKVVSSENAFKSPYPDRLFEFLEGP